MKQEQILKVINLLEKYPIELMLVKELILAGINSEQELVDLLKTDTKMKQATKISLQNYYRDISNGFQGLGINNIPTIFK